MDWHWKSIFALFTPARNEPPLCSFCGVSYRKIGPFIEGLEVYICGSCLRRAHTGFEPHDSKKSGERDEIPTGNTQDPGSLQNPYLAPKPSDQCSFCGLTEGKELARSPISDHSICKDCHIYSIQILEQEISKHKSTSA